MADTCTVLCSTCGTPMRVTFENGKIVKVLAVCKCPRPTADDPEVAEPPGLQRPLEDPSPVEASELSRARGLAEALAAAQGPIRIDGVREIGAEIAEILKRVLDGPRRDRT